MHRNSYALVALHKHGINRTIREAKTSFALYKYKLNVIPKLHITRYNNLQIYCVHYCKTC